MRYEDMGEPQRLKEGGHTLEKKCCGNCANNKYSWMFKEYICTNEESENCDLPTDYTECCEGWEEKDGRTD